MKKILIFGAGGFGREVQWLIERINQKTPMWQIEGYLDDGVEPGTNINGYKVLGGTQKLTEYSSDTAVVCAVGSSDVREKIINKIKEIGEFDFPNLIDPQVQMSDYIQMGEGNIICAGNILTVNIEIDDFVIINLDCTVGHDARLHSFVTLYPSVNVSGEVELGANTEIGTGANIIQGKKIGEHTIVGAGSVVIKDLPEYCTAVGSPAAPIKSRSK